MEIVCNDMNSEEEIEHTWFQVESPKKSRNFEETFFCWRTQKRRTTNIAYNIFRWYAHFHSSRFHLRWRGVSRYVLIPRRGYNEEDDTPDVRGYLGDCAAQWKEHEREVAPVKCGMAIPERETAAFSVNSLRLFTTRRAPRLIGE